jgi:hypothetical protein
MVALANYQAQTQSLLDDFGAVEYTLANLTTYINDARKQIAGASESIRVEAQLNLVGGTQQYPISSVTALPAYVDTLLTARMARLQTATGFSPIAVRSWEWFNSFNLCQPTTLTGAPTECALLQNGTLGILYFSPIPDKVYTAFLNGVALPINLVDNTTIEILSTPWTEAVAYYAAYLALLNAQRSADANAMWSRYLSFEQRATQMTTTTRLPGTAPGGVGARVAGTHMPITAPPPQTGRSQ